MAASPTPSNTLSIKEYLRTDYRPDVEYIDGELRMKAGRLSENSVVQWAHSRMH